MAEQQAPAKPVTPASAKAAVRKMLQKYGYPSYRLSARTVSFQDLARANCVFVTIHGWQPDPDAADLTQEAREAGFRLDFSSRP